MTLQNRRWSPLIAWLSLGLAALLPLAVCDARTAGLARNTLLLAAATTAISVPLGTLIAVLLVRTDLPGRQLLGFLMAGLLFVPLFLQTGAWQAGFASQGWYTLAYSGPAWLDGLRGAVWIHAVAALPWVALFAAAGLRNVERELEEQALLDGTPAQVFLHVTARRALPAIGVAALWVAVTTAGEMTVTDFFQIRTYAEELYTETAVAPEPDQLPLTALPGIAVTAWGVVAALTLVAGLSPVARKPSHAAPLVFPLGTARWPAALAMALLVAVVVGVPLGSLAWKAGVHVSQFADERIRSWSLSKCVAMVAVSSWQHAREYRWSLVIGSLAATAAVAIAAPLSWLARRGGCRALPALALTAAALAVPGPVVGVVIVGLMDQPGRPWLNWLYDHSIAAVWLAQTWRALPLPLLVLWQAWRSLSDDVLDAAAVDGAGTLARFWLISLPQRLPAVAIAWLVALAASLAEVDATFIVRPAGVETLSTWVFEQLHNGPEDVVTSVCLALFLGFQGFTLVVWRLARRRGAGF
jgi:iron(III) transport system permease protein